MRIDDESLHAVDDSIRPVYSQNQEDLERTQLVVSLRQLLRFWPFDIVPLLPTFLVVLQVVNHVLILGADSHQHLEVSPALLRNPLVRFGLLYFVEGLISLEEEV